jgi:hypothetical protein
MIYIEQVSKNIVLNRSERGIEQNCVLNAYTFSLEGKDYAISI